MKTNWITIVTIILNLSFATFAGICAKLWGTTGSQMWLYVGLFINIFAMFTFMLIIRSSGLAITSALLLLLTIMINVVIGFVLFHESITWSQWFGISLGLVAILFIFNVFKPVV